MIKNNIRSIFGIVIIFQAVRKKGGIFMKKSLLSLIFILNISNIFALLDSASLGRYLSSNAYTNLFEISSPFTN